MKKTRLILAILPAIMIFASTAESKAETFNGLYAGAAMGWFHKKIDFNIKNQYGFKEKHSFNSMPLDIHLGYMSSAPDAFLWAIEAAFGYSFFSKKSNIINAAGRIDGENVRGKIDYEQRTKFFAELAAKLGWNFGDIASYIILGVSGHQVEHKFHVDLELGRFGGKRTGSHTEKDFLFGVFPGVGIAFKICENVSARAEYKYHFQKSVNAVANKVDIKLGTHDLRVGVDYAF